MLVSAAVSHSSLIDCGLVCQSDLINELDDPTQIGLPPVTRSHLPDCDENAGSKKVCGRNGKCLAPVDCVSVRLTSLHDKTYSQP